MEAAEEDLNHSKKSHQHRTQCRQAISNPCHGSQEWVQENTPADLQYLADRKQAGPLDCCTSMKLMRRHTTIILPVTRKYASLTVSTIHLRMWVIMISWTAGFQSTNSRCCPPGFFPYPVERKTCFIGQDTTSVPAPSEWHGPRLVNTSTRPPATEAKSWPGSLFPEAMISPPDAENSHVKNMHPADSTLNSCP